jgi:dolichol-phosphate mannosyltransferase
MTDTAGFREVLRRGAPRAILHLGFDASGFAPLGEEGWRTNHLAPLVAMIEELSRAKAPRFVHTGSAWVLASGKQLAEDALVAPTLDYATVKARLDEALEPLSRDLGVPYVNLRLFNVFGRYEDRNRLLPHLVGRWRRGLPARLTHGEQVRDFNDVDDIAEAYRLALLCPPSACGAVYHIGSGRGVSVRQFASMAAAAMGAPGEIEFNSADTRDRHVPALVSDPGRAMRVLGWRPRNDLEVRIRDAVKWWLARPVTREEDAK